jgi:hypothetical protein
MRNAIVNAGLPGPLGSGGRRRHGPRAGRATCGCSPAASWSSCSTGVLAFNAGELWPHLFAH